MHIVVELLIEGEGARSRRRAVRGVFEAVPAGEEDAVHPRFAAVFVRLPAPIGMRLGEGLLPDRAVLGEHFAVLEQPILAVLIAVVVFVDVLLEGIELKILSFAVHRRGDEVLNAQLLDEVEVVGHIVFHPPGDVHELAALVHGEHRFGGVVELEDVDIAAAERRDPAVLLLPRRRRLEAQGDVVGDLFALRIAAVGARSRLVGIGIFGEIQDARVLIVTFVGAAHARAVRRVDPIGERALCICRVGGDVPLSAARRRTHEGDCRHGECESCEILSFHNVPP